MRTLITTGFLLLASVAQAEDRWVTLGAGVTEIVFALGGGDRVVGTDGTSLYPPQAAGLPKVGHHREVSAEAVLALSPTKVLAGQELAKDVLLQQLRASGVEVLLVSEARSFPEAVARVEALAEATGAQVAAAPVVAALREAAAGEDLSPAPRIAFVYARGAGTMMLGGRGTAVEAIVDAAGAELVAEWDGYRPISAEAVLALKPDAFLLTTGGLASLGGVDGFLGVPGIALTPAGQARRVLTLDDLLVLTLGPRSPDAVATLREALGASAP